MRFLLNLGAAAENDEPILEAVPKIKLPSEKGRTRKQTISEDEYSAILSNMGRPQQRVVICWWETAMRHEEPFNLKWSHVDLRANLIRMPASITKERCDRRVPISHELRQVLLELKEERLRTGVRDHAYVFIRENGARIRDITRAWEFALKRAKITDRRPHDFRRTRISAWTDAGVPTEAVKWWSRHKDSSVHGNYVIVTDEMVIKQFRERGWLLPPSERPPAAVKTATA